MQKDNLYKVECYRFFHSFVLFICMEAGFLAILFLSSDNADVLLGNDTPMGMVKATMRMVNLVAAGIVSAGISNYAGREFKQKTIYYEVMRGYSLWKISMTKTATCGIGVAVLLMCGILLFLAATPGALQAYSFIHILFMFFVLCHICACTTLYVMLCRNGVFGGCLSFFRFILLEVLMFFLLQLFISPEGVEKWKPWFVMSQWSAAVYMDGEIPPEYMTGILLGAVLEYVILLTVIQLSSKKIDL